MREIRNCVICAADKPKPVRLGSGRRKPLELYQFITKIGSNRKTCSPKCSIALDVKRRVAWNKLPSTKLKQKEYRTDPVNQEKHNLYMHTYNQNLDQVEKRRLYRLEPENIKKQRVWNKKYQQEPEVQQKLHEYRMSPENIRKQKLSNQKHQDKIKQHKLQLLGEQT